MLYLQFTSGYNKLAVLTFSHVLTAAIVIVIVIYFIFKHIQVNRSSQPLDIECVTYDTMLQSSLVTSQ